MTVLIKGAHILDPVSGMDEPGDILLRDGRFALVGGNIGGSADVVIDGAGLCAAPGLADIHVHLRDPGQTHKEDILSGAMAAAAGGFTAVCCMPNTTPAVDTPETVRYILQRARRAPVRVYPVAAITQGLQGEAFTDFAALRAAGAVALSDDGRPVADRARMAEAMRRAAENGLRIASHCEDLSIIDGGILHKGAVSEQLGVRGMDRRSEDAITERECALALETGAPVHICHVSTAGAVEAVRRAKAAGAPVTCETGAHYLLLTDQLLLSRDADYRMNPPLREQADCDAVCEGLVDGTIDCLITDHAPHSPEEKADFLRAPNGVVGLETSLAGCITALVETGRMSLLALVERMAVRPRQIMGLPGGRLQAGEAADLTLFDPKERWVVDPERFYSRARNTPFKGMELTGRVKYTFLDGRLTYMDQE